MRCNYSSILDLELEGVYVICIFDSEPQSQPEVSRYGVGF